jgi:GNAT superfamily N-acetyltransferase
MSPQIAITRHDAPPPAAAVVDAGLGRHNEAAAPLHEVRALVCLAWANGATAEPVGGAIGRTWGRCGELQQLWVAPAWRHHGLGRQLMEAFHAEAEARGCRTFYLETWSFQAPSFYRACGYEARLTLEGFGPGLAKHVMVRELGSPEAGP